MKKLSKSDHLKIFSYMLKIRRFEERSAQLYGMGHIGGFCHLYIAVSYTHLTLPTNREV